MAAAWVKADIMKKFGESAWARKITKQKVRASLTDFDRFKVMIARKHVYNYNIILLIIQVFVLIL